MEWLRLITLEFAAPRIRMDQQRRSIMRTWVLTTLASGCLLLGAASLVADEKKELEALDGTWKVEAFTVDGMKLPDELIKKVMFVIKDGKYTITIDGKEEETGTIKLDPDKTPKTIEFGITGGKDKGKKQPGIYKLDGDTFTFCMAHPGETERPTKLESAKDSKTVLSVLKREKK
jgi:uncharacterized protein (TIGR03067 family)